MKLKISQSIASAWLRKDYDSALKMLFGVETEKNEAMLYGITKHEEWEKEVKETGKLPEIFGGGELRAPELEKYVKVELDDWLWISGIIDVIDEDVIIDYKTGKTRASAYLGSIQSDFYSLLAPKARVFKYLHYDQYKDKADSAWIILDDEKRMEALNKIFSVAGEIRNWLENNGYEDFNNVDKALKKSEVGKI